MELALEDGAPTAGSLHQRGSRQGRCDVLQRRFTVARFCHGSRPTCHQRNGAADWEGEMCRHVLEQGRPGIMRAVTGARANVILVLGGGISVDGEPSPATRSGPTAGLSSTAPGVRAGSSCPVHMGCLTRGQRARRRWPWPGSPLPKDATQRTSWSNRSPATRSATSGSPSGCFRIMDGTTSSW